MINVLDLMSEIEIVSSSCGYRRAESQRETLGGQRLEILSDLQCHCLNTQEMMVGMVGY